MAGTGAVYKQVEDTNRRGPDFGKPNFGQILRAIFAPFLETASKALAALSVPIRWIGCSSTNFNIGRVGYGIKGVIIHTTVGTMPDTDATFNNPTRQASAHYAVAYDGSVVHQYVKESDTAWHCGRYYPDASHPLANVNTVGIEHVDNGAYNSPRSDGLYTTSAQLVKEICGRYGIPINRTYIRKHLEVSVAPTSCPDSLDIDRIVAMANGTYGPAPGQLTGDDDMLYVGPIHSVTGTAKVFAAGNAYKDPAATAMVAHTLAAAAALPVVGWRWTTSPVTSSDLDGQGHSGPDYVWWKAADGTWVPDAILNTTMFTGIPQGLALSTIPAAEPMSTYFANQSQLTGSSPDDDSAYATKSDVSAAVAAAPTKPHKHDVTVTATTNYTGATTDTV